MKYDLATLMHCIRFSEIGLKAYTHWLGSNLYGLWYFNGRSVFLDRYLFCNSDTFTNLLAMDSLKPQLELEL